MKGLKHNVIEINDTDNANIERILVFLTPQAEKVSVMTTRQEATQLLKELEVKKVNKKKLSKGFFYTAGAIITVLIILLLMFL